MNYKYPKSFWKIAEQLGHARTVMDEKIMINNPKHERGSKREHIDKIGVLGELIAMDYLTNKNIVLTGISLL